MNSHSVSSEVPTKKYNSTVEIGFNLEKIWRKLILVWSKVNRITYSKSSKILLGETFLWPVKFWSSGIFKSLKCTRVSLSALKIIV